MSQIVTQNSALSQNGVECTVHPPLAQPARALHCVAGIGGRIVALPRPCRRPCRALFRTPCRRTLVRTAARCVAAPYAMSKGAGAVSQPWMHCILTQSRPPPPPQATIQNFVSQPSASQAARRIATQKAALQP